MLHREKGAERGETDGLEVKDFFRDVFRPL